MTQEKLPNFSVTLPLRTHKVTGDDHGESHGGLSGRTVRWVTGQMK